MSQTISPSRPKVQAPAAKSTGTPPLKTAAPAFQNQERTTVSPAEKQPGADPSYLSGISETFAQGVTDYQGIANRTAGIVGDVAVASKEAAYPTLESAVSLKPVPTLLADKIVKAGPAIGGLGAVINANQGVINVGAGAERAVQGDSLADKGAGLAQAAQGGTQLAAAGTGAVNLTSTAVAKVASGELAGQAASLAGSTGKVLSKGLGPAIVGLEAAKNGAEAIKAYQDGNENQALEKGYLSVTKGGGASAMALAGPVGATIGAGVVLGTSIAEVLNQTECVQNAQRTIGDCFVPPVQDTPPVSAAERSVYHDQMVAHMTH